MKIGVVLEGFRKEFKDAVVEAKALGLDGVQRYCTNGEIDYTPEQRKEVLDILKSNGLEFSAICADYDWIIGYSDKARNDSWVIENTKRIIDLSKEWECNIITTHIGRITEEETETKKNMREACHAIAEYAASVGSCLAVETGTETAEILADFLESCDSTGIAVNFDPANLVMECGTRPVPSVETLAKYIVHTHAKDGIKTGPDSFLEVPLGEGGVDFDTYLPALKDNGFDGYLTIEREVGDNPAADIKLAVDFLREKLAKFSL